MKRAISLAAAAAVALAACAPDGADATNPTVVEVTMTDMAFTPAMVNATPGETVTFVFRNEGAVKHEAVFGSLAEQEKHHAEMAEGDATMADGHDSESMGSMPHSDMDEMHTVVAEPGETVEVTHKVDGPTLIGCHEPGHWEAGMKMEVAA